jgi:hypothetical protein
MVKSSLIVVIRRAEVTSCCATGVLFLVFSPCSIPNPRDSLGFTLLNLEKRKLATKISYSGTLPVQNRKPGVEVSKDNGEETLALIGDFKTFDTVRGTKTRWHLLPPYI